ncbi:efflux transporter outer membrane subunit [uncultured Desulfobulbus sp.]|uniref:efflux transporter outer membrane subunit n=1 Tax=uncultured Desulfobulbus sp. TaxID=239745 RepID=UPI0029C8920D|nr:efflux transporter outer membrane subunit [uncultured Desulfobulbus sp.]
MKTCICLYFGIFILAFSLTGCAALMHTPYQTPQVTLPSTWTHQGEINGSAQDRWWEEFGDLALNHLVAEALQRNNDLAAATIRVRQAQLQAEQAGSERLPSFSVQGNGEISRYLGSGNREIRNAAASAAVSYELDLWGKLGSSYGAARWEAMATEEDRAGTALSLIGTTASFYWQIGSLNQRIRQSEASIAYARKTLQLVQVQKTAGAASSLEILEAEGNLASQEASHTILIQQRVEARNGLAILFDGPPQSLKTTEPQDLSQATVPKVSAGLPAHLLGRRPDLRAAEARLRAALANTDATRASFYPAINLSGQLGGSSEQLARFLSNPLATLGADLALPFVQWRDMQRNIKISEAEYEQAIISFRQTLYNALADVENSLSARQQYREQALKLEQTLSAAKQTEELYRIRYQAGGSALKSWLDAQENRRQAEIALAENRLNQLQNHITLSKALGGGSAFVPAPTKG